MTLTSTNPANLEAWLTELSTTAEPQASCRLCNLLVVEGDKAVPFDEDNEEHVHLDTRTGYCCLGIGVRLVPGDMFPEPGEGRRKDWYLEPGSATLPGPEFIRWLGFEPPLNGSGSLYDEYDLVLDVSMIDYPLREDSAPYTPEAMRKASMLNDEWHLTFPQIADMVRYFGILYVEGSGS